MGSLVLSITPTPGVLRTSSVGHLPNKKTFVGKVRRGRSWTTVPLSALPAVLLVANPARAHHTHTLRHWVHLSH